MRERPAIGARIRLLGNTGLANIDGRTAKVVAPVNVRPARKATRERVRASA